MGVWADSTDGYDKYLDIPDDIPGPGYAGIYHENDPPTWTGPSDFYRTDFRSPLELGETEIWSGLYLWADPETYEDSVMYLSVEADPGYPPPAGWRFVVELLYVPEGIEGAPEVGETWQVDPLNTLTIEVPTYWAMNGLESYQFSFTILALPEPTTLVGLVVGVLLLRRR